MKKLIVGLLASFLIATGLVAFSGSPSIALADCDYPSCVKTKSKIEGPRAVRQGTAPKFNVSVKANGNARPKGTIKVTVTRIGGGFSDTTTERYNGRSERVSGPTVRRPGTYRVTVKFIPANNSPFKSSTDSYTFTVKRRG